MKRSKGIRTAALTCLLAITAIAMLVGVYWKDLVTQYHVYRLRTDSDYPSVPI